MSSAVIKARPRILIECPACGSEQRSDSEATSAVCRACGGYIRIIAPPEPQPEKKSLDILRRDIRCFQCGHEDAIPASAVTWQCVSCTAKVDLSSHRVDRGCGMNIFTYGGFTLGARGHFTGARVEAESVRLLGGSSVGVIVSRGKFTVEGNARLRANIKGAHLEVRPGVVLEARQSLEFETALIQGNVTVKQLKVSKNLHISSLGRLEAGLFQFSAITVEPGGMLRGNGTSLNMIKER